MYSMFHFIRAIKNTTRCTTFAVYTYIVLLLVLIRTMRTKRRETKCGSVYDTYTGPCVYCTAPIRFTLGSQMTKRIPR